MTESELKKGIIASKSKNLTEVFKGTVNDSPTFPKKLGAEHPYDFKITEGLYKSYPFVKGAVDKHADSIMSDFSVKCEDEEVQKQVEDFIKDTSFQVVLREWVISALVTGNGFLEIDLENKELQVLDPKTMWVRRNKKGQILSYNQYLSDLKTFGQGKEPVPFKRDQIAHLCLNKMPGEAYGYGIIWPNVNTLNNIIANENDMQKLIERKAGAPIHVKVGMPGEAVNPEDLTDFNGKLEYLNNRTEWVTDANVEMKVIDFGQVASNFTPALDYNVQSLTYGFQVPAVLMGIANINEGIGKVQLEAFQRRITAFQEDIEKVIEEKIFKPIVSNKAHVEVVWNLPGETEINNRIDRLSKVLNNSTNISENFNRMVQLELARVLEIEDADKFLRPPEVGLDDKAEEEEKNEKMEKNQLDAEVARAGIDATRAQTGATNTKPTKTAKPKLKPAQKVNPAAQAKYLMEKENLMTMKEWCNLQEVSGFHYSDYLANILLLLKKDKFKDLMAITSADIENGLLSQKQLESLRSILKDGFQKNQSVTQIETNIKNQVHLKDRLKDGKVTVKANERPNSIARTERSRLANDGLIETYKDNNIKKVEFLAAFGPRTCEECASLDGTIKTLSEADGMIPVHPSCRCTWIPA